MKETDLPRFAGLHSVEQRQGRLTVTGCEAAEAQGTRVIFARAVREQVAGGMEFDKRTAMSAGAPATHACWRVTIRAWD